MDFNAQPLGIYVRIVAIICLLLGLSDASRLLGVNMGAVSPIAAMGMSGFVYLAIFSLARLFAAVGLWIKASWGAVLLVASTSIELAMYLLGHPDIRISAIGFAVRLALLVSILIVLLLSARMSRARVAD